MIVRALRPDSGRVGPDPIQRGRESVLGERLEQVVESADLERLERIALVRGDEYDRRPGLGREARGHVEAAELRHLDIEKYHLGVDSPDRGDRLASLRTLADELHVRVLGEESPEPCARDRKSHPLTHAGTEADPIVPHGQVEAPVAQPRAHFHLPGGDAALAVCASLVLTLGRPNAEAEARGAVSDLQDGV